MKKRGVLSLIILAGCIVMLLCASCAGPQKDSIVIGLSRPLTGPLSIFEQMAFGPIYKLWAEEVNADGGIFVKQYGKKLPVVLKVYDDESDINKMTQNLEKLITEDKVDLILPSAGTDMLFAGAPIANEYGYVYIGAEGGASKLREIINDLPYFFSVLSFSDHFQLPALAELLAEKQVKTVSITFLSDLHGAEYAGAARAAFAGKGIEIVMSQSIPEGIEDMTPVIRQAMNINADAFLCFAYPDENILAVVQSMQMGFNPKVFLTGPGSNFQFFANIFGPAVEGITGWGAWNTKISPEHKALADKLTQLYGPEIHDWWGHNIYYGSLQFLQKAIEKAGTLDQKKIREVVANEKFETILGLTWFDSNQLLAEESYSGQVGQWQNGIFEVISPKSKATAEFVYPKPSWPK